MSYMNGLSGYIPVKNNFDLEYCAQLGVESLLPVCNEVIIGDAGSTDNTRQFFEDWAKRDARVRVVDCVLQKLPTPDEVERDDPNRPPGNPVMLVDWLNQIRQHCRFNTQITLDADEVLDPASYPEVRNAVSDQIPRSFKRLNFWKSPQWEAPHGTVCGEVVVRMGPTTLKMHSDEPTPEGEPEIRRIAIAADNGMILHLGFLRRQDAFLRKSRIVQAMIHNCYDSRLRQAERTGEPWFEVAPFPADKPLIPCTKKCPDYVNAWLLERGYTPN